MLDGHPARRTSERLIGLDTDLTDAEELDALDLPLLPLPLPLPSPPALRFDIASSNNDNVSNNI